MPIKNKNNRKNFPLLFYAFSSEAKSFQTEIIQISDDQFSALSTATLTKRLTDVKEQKYKNPLIYNIRFVLNRIGHCVRTVWMMMRRFNTATLCWHLCVGSKRNIRALCVG